jgi:catechol 2,3-dioxygenase-like lactoylglutathione lyase family enzyme
MAIQEAALATTSLSEGLGPNRLHHAAWVTLDSEATRHFYEDVLGVPLVATWCEKMNGQSYVHTFYAMRDGGALAFFEYADQARRDHLEFKSPGHLAFEVSDATQADLVERLEANGFEYRTIDHGYCRSLYVTDLNNLLLEFTVDAKELDAINARQQANCHTDLQRWLAGDHTPNNDIRAH